jgi:branched-chain amino acid transport system substrate-binding protein
MKKFLGLAAAVLAAALIVQGCAKKGGGETVRIGFIGPLTGDLAYAGVNMKEAVEIARDEINEKGGINGKKIEVIFEDGKCGPKEAANAGNKLINVDGVTAIIGGVCSSETLAVAPLAEKSKVILISAASTNPAITQAGDYVFRDVPSDAFQGIYAARFIKLNLNKSQAAILKCLSDWCMGVSDSFKAEYQRAGGSIVAEESFPQDSRDLRSQLVKIKAAKPQLVYFVSYTEASIVGLKQMKELGVKANAFGADAWSDPKIWESAGANGEGAMWVEPANKAYPPGFVDAMRKKAGDKVINVYAPRAYDAMKMLAMVMEKAGTDTRQIKKGLYEIRNYQGIADNYTFDANGDITAASYVVRTYRGGKMTDAR